MRMHAGSGARAPRLQGAAVVRAPVCDSNGVDDVDHVLEAAHCVFSHLPLVAEVYRAFQGDSSAADERTYALRAIRQRPLQGIDRIAGDFRSLRLRGRPRCRAMIFATAVTPATRFTASSAPYF